MYSNSTFLIAVPALIALLAAAALFIVHRSLSRVRHALVWAAAFALATIRWLYAAFTWARTGADFLNMLVFDTMGLFAVLLLAEGFRLRNGSARPVPKIVGCLALPAILVLYAFPPAPLRTALIPLISSGLIGWSATIVAPRSRRWSPAEAAVITMLGTLSAIHFITFLLALAEQVGLVPSHALFIALYFNTIGPMIAAAGLFTLLLICFDFSAEQKRLINTDPLTGVMNRLGIEDVAQRMVERSRRRNRALSVAIADIDGFKGINDRAGHAAGDATLIGFAEHLAGALVRDEAVGRTGGEEFLLLLPGCDGASALSRIEPVRAGLCSLCVPDLPEERVTASFGIAEHKAGETLEQTIARADAALYVSKREGRDRATLAPQAR